MDVEYDQTQSSSRRLFAEVRRSAAGRAEAQVTLEQAFVRSFCGIRPGHRLSLWIERQYQVYG